MIVEKEFLKKIKQFRLNSYEAKLWVALLSRGASSAGELSEIADVPRSRTYDVLESLEKKGFIIMKMEKPIKYIAIPPREVLERIKKRIKYDADEKLKNIDDIKDSSVVNELNSLYKNGVEMVEPSEISGSLKGRDNIHDHINMMVKEAESSIIIVTTTEGLKRKLEFLKTELKRAKERGVRIRVAAPLNENHKEIIKEFKDIIEFKHIGKIKGRFILIDSDELIFMIMDDEEIHPSYDVGIWVNTKMFATILKDLFEISWENMDIVEKSVKI